MRTAQDMHEALRVYNGWWDTDVQYLMGDDGEGGAIGDAAAAGETVVVLTHHAPTQIGTTGLFSPDDHPHFWSETSNFEGNLKFGWKNVAAWCHGHTHYNSSRVVAEVEGVGATRVMSNQAGYVDTERRLAIGSTPFDPACVLELPPLDVEPRVD